MQKLATKLLKVQSAMLAITKDSQNPFFKSNYFDINSLLGELKPLLNDNKLVVLQPLSKIMGKNPRMALRTIIIDQESGESIEDTVPLPENNDPQKMGGAITYFRRYALQSIFLLQAEDDDGNEASGHRATKETGYIKNSDNNDLGF